MKSDSACPVIHVVGVQRTGQHAISSWLIGHYEKAGYKNNMSAANEKRFGFCSPFWYFEPKKTTKWIESNEFKADQNAWILGTEYICPPIMFNPNMKSQMGLCGLYSSSEKIVIVIRNPYNHYASVLRWKFNRALIIPENFKKTWIAMAKEALGETNNFPKDLSKTVVIFDKWFADRKYRTIISKEVTGKPLNDLRLNVVMKIGFRRCWGSSFDKMKKQSFAQSMNVLNRKEAVKNNAFYKQIENDEEIKSYMQRLGI